MGDNSSLQTSPIDQKYLLNQNTKPGQAAECGARMPFERLIGETKVWEALHDGKDCELSFEPRQRRAEAEMRATTERVMVRIRPRDIEAIRLRVDARIAIRGGEGREH